MRFALIGGTRSEALSGASAVCCFCHGQMIAKCGEKVRWHWAHVPRPCCDPWWENETDWHRHWKSRFPISWQEVIHVCPTTGERHVADVKTDSGLVIEFQNSPMDHDERAAREAFYRSMVWVINGSAFEFTITEPMPDPATDLGTDLEFVHPQAFRRRSDGETNRIYLRPWEPELESRILDASNGHHAFEWNRSRPVWLGSRCPVYFDLGGDELWLLVSEFTGYLDPRKTFACGTVRRIDKATFVRKHRGLEGV